MTRWTTSACAARRWPGTGPRGSCVGAALRCCGGTTRLRPMRRPRSGSRPRVGPARDGCTATARCHRPPSPNWAGSGSPRRCAPAGTWPAIWGARRFADVVAAVEPRSVSAETTRARLRLAAVGFVGFSEGQRVRIAGRAVPLPLADPALRCAVVFPSASTSPADGPGAERYRAALRRAGWTVIVVRGPAAPGSVTRPAGAVLPPPPGRVCDPGVGGVLPALRSLWPEALLLPPLPGEPVADPLGMWAGRSA